jgi:putative DNA primase/helicase
VKPKQHDHDDPPARLQQLLARLDGAKRSGDGWKCRCPAHPDKNPSLSISLADDGKILVRCHAGCTTASVMETIGLPMALLSGSAGRQPHSPHQRSTKNNKQAKKPFPSLKAIADHAAKHKKGTVESTHTYANDDGTPAFAVIRVRQPDGGKEIPQVRPEGDGWVYGGIGNNRPLYNLPALLAASPATPVAFVEGEQKAELMKMLGFLSTSTSQGAGNAGKTDLSPLAGRVVHLFDDNDEPGRKHMQQVAELALAAGAKQVLVVTLPGLPEKGDIVDFVEAQRAAGKSDAEIVAEIRAAIAAAVEPPAEAEPEIDLSLADEPTIDSLADHVVAIAKDAHLFHDDQGDTYATYEASGHMETAAVDSRQFGQWLMAEYYRSQKRAVPQQAMKTACDQLSAMARFDGPKKNVFLRTARVDDMVLVDLCNDSWQAVEITRDNWSVTDIPKVPFIRRTGMRSLPMPVKGWDKLDPLFDLLNIENDDDRLLITAWLVNSMLPSSSYPILCATGEQGSGKTTFCRACQRTVDPHQVEGRSPPRNEEDIAVAAKSALVLVYENLSTITLAISDAFCRVATGAGFAARKLFTNDEERQLSFCRPLIINGIDDLATRSDLADRIVHIHLHPIPKPQRQTEAELWRKFEAMHGQLLGALFTLVSRVLATDNLDIQLERMAEFTQIGAKTALALGRQPEEFLDAYRRNRDASSITALESSAVGPVIRRMLNNGSIRRPIGALLFELQTQAHPHELKHPDWPKHPRALGNELRRLSPNFARIGITVHFPPRRNDGCWVEIVPTTVADIHDVHDVHGGPVSG